MFPFVLYLSSFPQFFKDILYCILNFSLSFSYRLVLSGLNILKIVRYHDWAENEWNTSPCLSSRDSSRLLNSAV